MIAKMINIKVFNNQLRIIENNHSNDCRDYHQYIVRERYIYSSTVSMNDRSFCHSPDCKKCETKKCKTNNPIHVHVVILSVVRNIVPTRTSEPDPFQEAVRPPGPDPRGHADAERRGTRAGTPSSHQPATVASS